MQGFLIAIPIVLIVMSMSACQGSSGPAGEQGPPGPVGPAGPTGEAATLDKDELQLVLQQLESAEARITADGPASGQQLMQGQTEALVPSKWMPEAYTNYFVREAIRQYESDGLDSTVAYYNTTESVDGQWYVFMIDEDGTVIAHANPALVGQLASDVLGPNDYPHRRCRSRFRRRKRRLVRLHFHQPCHGLGGDQTFLDGNSRRHYLRVRLVRGRAAEDRRPGLHGGSSPAGH